MAAGQGFKTFVTGEVLTAADTNGYLMQGINVFATTAARDAAITAPAEGQFAFTKDTNSLWYYDGAAWVASGATGDIEGVTAGTGISGGGTSGTVTITNSMATAIDAKGDLVAGTGADAFSRLAVGANSTVLTADSTAATGLKWAASGVKDWQLLNAGGTALTGATTITVSGISSKSDLMIFIAGGSSVNAASNVSLQLNTDTGSNYVNSGLRLIAGSTYAASNSTVLNTGFVLGPNYGLGKMSSNASSQSSGYIMISGCNSGDKVAIQHALGFTDGGGNSQEAYVGGGIYDGTAAITSVSVVSSTGNFDNGTIYVYGA